MERIITYVFCFLLVAFFHFYHSIGMTVRENEEDKSDKGKEKCNEICLFQRELQKKFRELEQKSPFNFTFGSRFKQIKVKY